jgi:hypothetical protein
MALTTRAPGSLPAPDPPRTAWLRANQGAEPSSSSSYSRSARLAPNSAWTMGRSRHHAHLDEALRLACEGPCKRDPWCHSHELHRSSIGSTPACSPQGPSDAVIPRRCGIRRTVTSIAVTFQGGRTSAASAERKPRRAAPEHPRARFLSALRLGERERLPAVGARSTSADQPSRRACASHGPLREP